MSKSKKKDKPKDNKDKPKPKKRILSVLIGPCGSGKTHYASSCLYNHKRISQDDMGRNGHYKEFLYSIIDGFPKICIDRMNFDIYQRLRYIVPAKFYGYKIHYYLFTQDEKLCLKRMSNRANHPTLNNSDLEKQKEVFNFFMRSYEKPEEWEYNEINDVLPKQD